MKNVDIFQKFNTQSGRNINNVIERLVVIEERMSQLK